jgi:hypothetical protein
MDKPRDDNQPPSPQEIAADFVQKGLGILEPAQRAAYMAERLAQLDAKTLVEVLRTIFEGAAKRVEGYREFLESGINPVAIRDQLGRFKFSRVYHYASRSKYDEIVSLFSRSRPARSADGDEDMFLVYGEAERTVGERRFMARSTDKSQLDKIGYDLNPLVIRQLLTNPRLTEQEVLKIASRRPNTAEVLTEIYQNKKWLARYIIKFALAANPYTPPHIGRALLPFLLMKDLRQLRLDGTLTESIRQDAERLYQVKLKEAEGDPKPEPGNLRLVKD